ncbi:c-type cytochrome [Rhodoferax antarcticus]|uniref:c-type cytochrome n=1 Tax=Rhodoferax antarcticus TaxID=81479 RepID=UPI002224AB92|nr:c-type cytochrome [Rhodoferax antarcticus]MCW2312003.1 cytochrome c [Rhodoferax antarcticus]
MFSFRKVVAGLALLGLAGLAGAQSAAKFSGIGRDATVKELQAWDIDVRPDFKGLPPGSGSVAKGQDIWEEKCATCHGIFGDSGEFFNPIIGGVTAKDIESGHVANLIGPGYPGRTTFMKVATVSTLWDFIFRAMPWTEPKSLAPDDVYAVLAFMLNLSNIVPENFVLSDKTIRDVQSRMPNRNGMMTDHTLWPGNEFSGAKKPDTSNVACMANCAPEPKLASFLPDFARNAHGNLAEQNRLVGAQRGADTAHPERKLGETAAAPVVLTAAEVVDIEARKMNTLLQKNGCTICHGMHNKIVGPAYTDVARKYAGKVEYLQGKIKSGGVGVWGALPMPAQTLSDTDAISIAEWLAAGGPK